MALKKYKNPLLNLQSTRNKKKSSRAQICFFFWYFQCKEIFNLNSSHEMEPFKTKINSFSGWNHRQQLFLSWNSATPFLLR
jgi:hypothetical protein